MITALFGFTYALVLLHGDVQRENLSFQPITFAEHMYAAGNVEWDGRNVQTSL